MSSNIAVGLLGVAVTLNVAAIAALGWLINFVIRLDGNQTASRATMAAALALQSREDHRSMSERLDRIEDRLNAAQVVIYRPRRHDND